MIRALSNAFRLTGPASGSPISMDWRGGVSSELASLRFMAAAAAR
jgi:hypothetical protein